MKSSSFHRISADRKNFFYKLLVRLVYFPFNWINNIAPSNNIDPRLKFTQFKLLNFNNQYTRLEKTESPTRKLSNLFWMNYKWDNLQKIHGKINICDIGAGSGKYYEKLQEYSNNRITKYLGLDIYKNNNWEKLKSSNINIDFKLYDGKNIIELIPKETNIIISQSAIEHFNEDITIFKQIRDFIDKSDHKIYQIHLFPASSGLKMYRYHGIRQYTPRTISKITNLFTNSSNLELVILGAKKSIKVHRKYITKPFGFGKDLREIKTVEYNTACLEAIKIDMSKKNKVENAAFYALLID